MPTNNLAPKTKNYLSSIPPNMAERFGSAVSPYLQSVQGLFPPTNPYGQALSNFLLGQAPQAAQRMAEGYPNVLFDTRNLLGGNRIVNPVALDMLGALPVATALKGAGLAKGGVAATFAGARAKTANKEALAVAEKMKALGAPDEEIHKATGWFFGSADGKPRFEIPDDAARLNAGALRDFHNDTSLVRQSRLMQHPELSAAYPDTGNIPYRKHNSPGASYDPAEDAINIPQGSGHPDMSQELRDTAVKSPALHELQHAVQQREGFARGGSPEMFNDTADGVINKIENIKNSSYYQQFENEINQIENSWRNIDFSKEVLPDFAIAKAQQQALKQAEEMRHRSPFHSQIRELEQGLSLNITPGEQYRRLAGEAEARLTQSRMDMTGAERAASYPPGMYDVPVGDQIVRYGEGPALATTWHGSPHKFEPTELNDLGEFNAAKIGSGEGTQLEGFGHYLAQMPDVADSYAGWTPIKIDGKPVTYAFPNSGNNKKYIPEYDGPINNLAKSELAVANHPDEAIDRLVSSINKIKQDPSSTESDQMAMRNMTRAVDWIEKNKHRIQGSYVYKVEIPDDFAPRMLDWDAGGKKTWADAVAQHGTPAAAAEALSAAGTPGVRYLDAGSRLGPKANSDTSNFVVFPGNEHMMTILERNGQAMSPESQAIARYREIKGPKSVVRMEAALRTAGVPLPKNEPVAYIQRLVDQAHRRN